MTAAARGSGATRQRAVQRSGGRRRGFTVIELLVVIAIIVILAGILLPVLRHAMVKGESASCLSNLRNLALAARLYADDHDDQIIPARLDDPGGSLGICWDVTIQAYVRSLQLLVCPGDEAPRAAAGCVSYPHSYGINFQVSLVGGYNGSSLRLSQVVRPVELILFFELVGTYRNFGADYDMDRLERVAPERHGAGSNYSFLDGHAKWLRLEATVEPKNLWRR